MHESYKKWLNDGQPKIYCMCGCGGEIVIKNHHEWRGIPKYIHGHNPVLEETKIKWKESRSGSNHWHFGKKDTESHKEKLSKVHEGIKQSESTKNKIAEFRKGKWLKENNPAWKGGIWEQPYCKKWNERLREKIRNEYNRKCYICGKEEKNNITKTNKIRKLSVHHIDMDKEQGCDGKKWKLVPLCMYCHSRLHHNKVVING